MVQQTPTVDGVQSIKKNVIQAMYETNWPAVAVCPDKSYLVSEVL